MNRLTKQYITNLSNSKKATQYLLDRHLAPQTIKKFGLGLSLSEREEIVNPSVNRLGLISIYENGKKAPFYYNRIMIPIKDNNGKIAGFTARTLFNAQPKYKNSRASKEFDKSTILYNLWCIENNRSVILFESQMNVMAFDQHKDQLPKKLKNNTPHPIATGGTALTLKHIQELGNKGVTSVYIAFDGDKAGRRATIRAIKLLRNDFMVWVVRMPQGKDMMDLLPDYEAIDRIVFIDSVSGDEYLVGVMKYLKKLYSKYNKLEESIREAPVIDFWKWWRVDSIKLREKKRLVVKAYNELEKLVG